jgi:hypothetical protein
LRQHAAVENALQHLGVYFDARHIGIVRCGLEIEQACCGSADQHKPLRDAVGGNAAFDHVDG